MNHFDMHNSDMSDPLLELHNCVHQYSKSPGIDRPTNAIRVDRLIVHRGDSLAILGPNGSGKSTLIEILGSLLQPTRGRLLYAGQPVWESARQLDVRRQTPILLQKTFLFSGNVLRNVMYGLKLRGVPNDEALRRAERAMRLTDVLHLAQRRHHQLSGGERRRVALAAVLALETDTILLDEPTVGLDYNSQCLVEELIQTINREQGVTIIFSSHDMRQASDLSTRRVSIWNGRMIDGTLDNLLPGRIHRDPNGRLTFEHAHRQLRIPLDDDLLCNGSDTKTSSSLADMIATVDDSLHDIVIDPDRIELHPLPDDGQLPPNQFRARLASQALLRSVGSEEDRLKLTVTCNAIRLVVRVPVTRFRAIGLHVGDDLTIQLRRQSIRLLND